MRPLLAIERKGYEVRPARNYLRLIMTSNSEWVIPAGMDERRFFVLDVSPERKQDTRYFGAIARQMDNGGLAAMMYDLQRHAYSDVDLRTVPQTEALTEQKIHSLDPKDRWLYERLCDGCMLSSLSSWESEIPKAALHEDYVESLNKVGIRRKITSTELGVYLRKTFGPALRDYRPKRGEEQVRCWEFPSLQESREIFERKIGKLNWPGPGGLSVVRLRTIRPSIPSRSS